MTQQTLPPKPKKNSALRGCLGVGGGILALVGLVVVLFGAILAYACVDGVESRRAESDARWREYVADSVRINAQYRAFEQQQAEAYERGDTVTVEALNDSLEAYSEPRPFLGGENIGAAFGIAFVVIGLVPLLIGIAMLVVFFMGKTKKRSN
ncbi:MAG: hypothetical protein IJM81_09580 [Prevotella sp.]|nr:hypothetical protein [Prevotella sp.]